ncbi:MAG TPA: hypothetical protein VJ184_12405 [Chryseolinea sp.]|nr:hypothetical protein [Chryseolinea sp.]
MKIQNDHVQTKEIIQTSEELLGEINKSFYWNKILFAALGV